MRARAFLAGFLLASPFSVAFAAPVPPSGGNVIQELPQVPPPVKPIPEIKIERGGVSGGAVTDHTKIAVRRLRITGALAYSADKLIAVAGFRPGAFTLAELRAMAERITSFYRKHGYFVARAYIPAQEIHDDTITIAVVEGRYGQVSIQNGTNLSNHLAQQLLGKVQSGESVEAAPLERGLLLLSDVPGVDVHSTLVPGASVGASNLIVKITPGPKVSGSMYADNEGNPYTGANRVGMNFNLNDPTGHGDVLSAQVLQSNGAQDYGRAAYQTQVGAAKVGVAIADMGYQLGGAFSNLGANGTAKIKSIYGSYPLLRGRENDLYAQLDYDDKQFEDLVNSTSSVSDRRAGVWMLNVNGDHRSPGGADTYSLTLTDGRLEIQPGATLATDASTARTNGHYNKFSLSTTRVQAVTDTVSLYGALHGQLATRNLDVSEKMELGGADAVRAYPEGEAFGDEGYVLNLEVHKLVSWNGLPGQKQLIGFFDTGMVKLDKNPWAAGQNVRALSGFGIGLNWIGERNEYIVKTYYAHTLGAEVATSVPAGSSQFWIQAIRYF